MCMTFNDWWIKINNCRNCHDSVEDALTQFDFVTNGLSHTMSLTSVVVVMAITQASDFNLHLLNPAIYPEALCLDGTQGGYYFRKGSGEWLTVLQLCR